jgi:hypothetical protein
MAFDLLHALRWFHGGDKKTKPAFKSEREAYTFLRNLYNKTGGVTPELRRTYEFYQRQQSDENCEPPVGPVQASGHPLSR